MHKSRVLVALLLYPIFLLAAVGVNYPGLDAPMAYDSRGNIEDRQSVFDTKGVSGAVSLFPQRPLPMITFYLNYLAGGMDPALFRIVNLAILAAVGLIVVLLVDLVLCVSAGSSGTALGPVRLVSVFLGLLFVVHPVQTYVTLYIWQRMALMACMFYYAAFTAYLAARMDLFRKRAEGYALCIIFFLGALLSKENTFTLPFVLLMAEASLFRERWKACAWKAVVFGLIFVACVGLVGLLQHPHGNEELGTGIVSTIALYYYESGLTPVEAILTQCRLLFRYLAQILLPLPSSMLLTSSQVVSRSLFNPAETFAAVIGVLALIALGVFLLRKRPVSGFGILFFITNLIPEAVLVPQYLFCGYRAVLPMLGLLLVIADVVSLAVKGLTTKPELRLARAVLAALSVIGVLFAAGLTSIRATIWSNSSRFWETAWAALPPISGDVERVPLLDILGNYGGSLVDSGDCARAIRVLEPALSALLNPRTDGGIAREVHAGDGDASTDRTRATRTGGLAILLGKAYRMSGRTADAVALFQRELQRSPESAALYNSLGLALAESGRVAEAVESYQKALAIDPGLAEAYNNLGAALRDTGRREEAITQFGRALEVEPRFALAHVNLALAYMDEGNLTEALRNCLRAVKLDPRSSTAHGVLGRVLEATGRHDLAVQSYRTEAHLDPKSPDARRNLERALKQQRQGGPQSD